LADLLQLGHAINQIGDAGTEGLANILRGNLCVFRNIVQQGSGDGVRVHVQIGQNRSRVEGMYDVRFFGRSFYARVGIPSHLVRMTNDLDIIRR